MKPNVKIKVFSKAFNWSVFITVVFLLFLQHCTCKSKKPILEIKSIKAPQGIAFIDVNSTVPHNVPKVKVTLIDPDGMVLSSNGIAFDTVEISKGVMTVGLSPKAEFSVQKPYRFTIRAEAEGYMTNMRSIVITDSTSNYIPVYLVSLDNSRLPRSGLATSVGNLSSFSGGIFTRAEVLQATLPQGNVDPLIISIQDSTQLLNGDKPIQSKDTLSFRLLFGIPGDTNANRAFPGGFEVTDAVNEDGKRISDAANPIFFTTAGWFTMEMNVGNLGVTGFSKPVNVEIPIGDTVINPATQRPMKAGDRIPFWSLDNRTGTWRLESSTEIMASNSGGLKATITINHLSSFNLDVWTETTCDLNIPFTRPPFTGQRYTEFINSSTNSLVRGKIVDYSAGPSSLEILRVPTSLTAASPGKLLVHQTTDIFSPLIGGRPDITCIGPWQNIAVLGDPSFPSVTIKFVRQDATGSVVVNNTVWHKPDPSIPTNIFINVGTLNATTGLLDIPHDPSINQLFQLWYLNTSNIEVILQFTMNVTTSGTGNLEVITGGVVTSTLAFSYTVTSPGPGTSQSLITIGIPASVI